MGKLDETLQRSEQLRSIWMSLLTYWLDLLFPAVSVRQVLVKFVVVRPPLAGGARGMWKSMFNFTEWWSAHCDHWLCKTHTKPSLPNTISWSQWKGSEIKCGIFTILTFLYTLLCILTFYQDSLVPLIENLYWKVTLWSLAVCVTGEAIIKLTQVIHVLPSLGNINKI